MFVIIEAPQRRALRYLPFTGLRELVGFLLAESIGFRV